MSRRRTGNGTQTADHASATGRRPPAVVLTGAVIRPLDETSGHLVGADVRVEGGVVTAIGPGLRAAAGADARVVDGTGTTLVPAADDGSTEVGALVPGSPATFGQLPTRVTRPARLDELVWYTDRATLWIDGAVAAPEPVRAPTGRTVDSPLVGTWYDERADVVQELGPDGRYDETRGGRRHAYQGCFWVHGEQVVYRDDLGFWAYATLRGTTLHHVHFRFRRLP
jgi:hypothetical protein